MKDSKKLKICPKNYQIILKAEITRQIEDQVNNNSNLSTIHLNLRESHLKRLTKALMLPPISFYHSSTSIFDRLINKFCCFFSEDADDMYDYLPSSKVNAGYGICGGYYIFPASDLVTILNDVLARKSVNHIARLNLSGHSIGNTEVLRGLSLKVDHCILQGLVGEPQVHIAHCTDFENIKKIDLTNNKSSNGFIRGLGITSLLKNRMGVKTDQDLESLSLLRPVNWWAYLVDTICLMKHFVKNFKFSDLCKFQNRQRVDSQSQDNFKDDQVEVISPTNVAEQEKESSISSSANRSASQIEIKLTNNQIISVMDSQEKNDICVANNKINGIIEPIIGFPLQKVELKTKSEGVFN